MKHVVLAFVMTFVAGAAHAQMWVPNPDLNKDGKVTLSEFQQTQANGILRLDADKDGKITRAEAKPLADRAPNGAAMVDRIWSRLDANKDGVITRAEIDAGAKRRFDLGDTNKDGSLSKDEIQALRQNRGRDAG